jgi:hypothetical protein
VKEKELNVAVKRNKVEVRITLPHTGVRKLTQVRVCVHVCVCVLVLRQAGQFVGSLNAQRGPLM